MDKASIKKAREILDNYLAASNHRKTAERYHLLELIYSFPSMCSVFDIQQALERDSFIVSRATIYNTLRLFIDLHLIIRHQMEGEARYEAAIGRKNHCCQICTSCGKVTELSVRSIPALLNNIQTKRFRNENFSITIYGICSSCIAKSTRQKKEEAKKARRSK